MEEYDVDIGTELKPATSEPPSEPAPEPVEVPKAEQPRVRELTILHNNDSGTFVLELLQIVGSYIHYANILKVCQTEMHVQTRATSDTRSVTVLHSAMLRVATCAIVHTARIL